MMEFLFEGLTQEMYAHTGSHKRTMAENNL